MVQIHNETRGRIGSLALGLALVLAPGCTNSQPASPANPGAPASPSAGSQAGQVISPLSANDVSWLFPPPKTAADLSRLIAVKDLTVPDPANPGAQIPAWSDADFAQFLALAESPAAQAGGSKIVLPPAAHNKDAWFVAGVRIDAGAPGLDPAITRVFGQRPQIRLILQPVLTPGGAPQVQDVTAHLIFDFVVTDTPANLLACPLHAAPDLVALKGIVADAAALRDSLAAGQFGGAKVVTAGQPLGVHPGLANPTTAPLLTAQMKALLQKRLSPTRLSSMAVMSVPTPGSAPWIFLSMLRDAQSGRFNPVPGPTLDGLQFAMALTPVGQSPRVTPQPHTNNQAPITCASNIPFPPPLPAPAPVQARKGVATADVFANPALDDATTKAILDRIANPTQSHFFNTDCVSCHTETRRAMEGLHVTSAPGLSSSVMPNGPWNVRNFGWSPQIEGPVQGTVTRRTANETAAVLAWINANALK